MKLYGRRQWGSMLVEAQLDWYGMDYEFETVGDLIESPTARNDILPINPVGQIPILTLESGEVMTESAAITLLLAEMAGSDELVPSADHPDRAAFLRWLLFLVANIYPVYFFGDNPGRFVPVAEARDGFVRATDDYAQDLFKIMDSEAGAPWFLGTRFSAVDVFVCCMTRWRPGRAWFADAAPRLHAIALRADALLKLKPCWDRNLEA